MSARFVYGEDARVLAWAQEKIGNSQFRGDAKSIAYERDGELVGAFVYDTFSRHSCLMHVASDGSRRWLTRNFLVVAFAFPFLQCGYHRVTALISERNTASLQFCQHLGGAIEGRMREAGPEHEDLIVLGMLRNECRYLPNPLAGQTAPFAL